MKSNLKSAPCPSVTDPSAQLWSCSCCIRLHPPSWIWAPSGPSPWLTSLDSIDCVETVNGLVFTTWYPHSQCACVGACVCVRTHARACVSLALAQASFAFKEEKPAATGSRRFAGAFTGSSLPPSIRLSLPDWTVACLNKTQDTLLRPASGREEERARRFWARPRPEPAALSMLTHSTHLSWVKNCRVCNAELNHAHPHTHTYTQKPDNLEMSLSYLICCNKCMCNWKKEHVCANNWNESQWVRALLSSTEAGA